MQELFENKAVDSADLPGWEKVDKLAGALVQLDSLAICEALLGGGMKHAAFPTTFWASTVAK